ncbi:MULTISPECIES: HAD-IIA family hydrolase [Bradyrhizobium]|uniref:Acid sugar phosphatase n=3 Tax=Bradyrhizobium TaxID=374 RepID=A0A410VIN9_9BRAD|nr:MULTISPECIES: HAD-IIA family hydrolase [Bradyrhizobium]MCG2628080.1 HAD-IIA family hydrolase [Bradyrhizobium zhengyangense]MCG2643199.1 HAD-IIA family hydrolase [Bradyrhizobium zhengyangense]MCG2670487.1 HAD-IIA family hydrolase [Bradyrhizobium zhengyangense]MDN4985778.1 HAD-IIA family hydrolase [Bradyrhizobium sp. WYCCWR 13022]MDT4736619.1 HAD-IIA family hydrolase [Bradyrhizobium sp. WYCCWR 12699]
MAKSGTQLQWPEIAGVISDLDGVVYRGNAAIADAIEAFKSWQRAKLPFCFVTNNSTHTPEDVVRKVGGFGLSISPRQVVTSAITAAALIRAQYPKLTRAFVIGAPSLAKAIEEAGLEVTDAKPEVVVMGLDRQITHDKLRIAAAAILGGAVFIGTNPDLLLPTADGFEPGAGAMITAVAAATQVQPLIVGKPETHMIEAALSRLGTPRQSTLMIGDQIQTDIQAGKRAGLPAVLVTTGVPPRKDAALLPADFTVSSLSEIAVKAGVDTVRQRRA